MIKESNEVGMNENQQSEEPVHHRSWLGTIIERIQDLDSDFPLSGGDYTHPHVVRKHHYEPEVKEVVAKKPEPVATPVKDEAEHHTSWFGKLIHKIQDLDVDFPLSGGESSHRN